MSTFGEDLIRGMEQALAYMDGTGDPAKYRVTTFERTPIPETVDVKAIRERMGLSQTAFSNEFGLSVNAVRKWEQGTRKPDQAARAYLKVIGHNPQAVREALLADA